MQGKLVDETRHVRVVALDSGGTDFGSGWMVIILRLKFNAPTAPVTDTKPVLEHFNSVTHGFTGRQSAQVNFWTRCIPVTILPPVVCFQPLHLMQCLRGVITPNMFFLDSGRCRSSQYADLLILRSPKT